MCLDISFKIDSTEDSLYDYLPNLRVNPQLTVDYPDPSHGQAHGRYLSPVILLDSGAAPYMTSMRWGVVMEYMLKDLDSFNKYSNNTFNAQSERIFDTKSTWYRIRKYKCLIPAPGIYEHRAIKGWKKKVPYYVRLANGKMWLLPGFYYFLDVDGATLQKIRESNDIQWKKTVGKLIDTETGNITPTFSMITQPANEKMRNIHNDGPNKHRMPMFRQPEDAVEWLKYPMADEEMKRFLEKELPSEELDAYPVDTIRGGYIRPDGKEKDQPFEWAGLPPLGNDDPKAPQASLF